jgi:hypothetical protein
MLLVNALAMLWIARGTRYLAAALFAITNLVTYSS